MQYSICSSVTAVSGLLSDKLEFLTFCPSLHLGILCVS